jgi:hypothetical protein
LLLADEFWLLAHDDSTGRPRLSGGVLGLGLASAQIGELAGHGNVLLHRGQVHVRAGGAPPSDELTRAVLDTMETEPPGHPIRTWLVYLSRTAPERVARRLVRQGVLRREHTRKMLKQVVTYRPVDANRAAWPLARLSTALRRQSLMAEPDAVLAGLAVATGLDRLLIRDAGTEARDYLAHLVSSVALPYHELISHTEAAVGDAVLSRRA